MISPPFAERANAATARSISPASRMLTGLTSTPSDRGHEHDPHRAAHLLQRPYYCACRGHNDVRRKPNQLGGKVAKAVAIADAPAIVDPHIAPDGPTQLLQLLQERRIADLTFRI